MKIHPEVIHQRIADLLRSRSRFVVATLLETKGSCPQVPGARMLVHSDARIEFTIGGGTFEAEVIQDSLSALQSSQTGIQEYRLTKDDIGMYCQGVARVLLEPHSPRPQIIIFGGGHVSQALSRIASTGGLFEVHVIDDRKEFADPEKHPVADHVIHTDSNFEEGVPTIDEETYLVIVTRCHTTDKMLVRKYLSSPARYIGMIGSRPKSVQLRRELVEEGVPASMLASLHSPIGLPIGGKSPAEVAVSILAEIIQTRNQSNSPEQHAKESLSRITSVSS